MASLGQVISSLFLKDGQAIVNAWNVQSGNHSNPEILYDPSATATQREVLQLVE